MSIRLGALGLLGLLCAQRAAAQSTTTSTSGVYQRVQALDEAVEEIVVTGRSTRPAASTAIVRSRDLLLRPRRRAADLLEVTPGLKVAQHAGGGKANQYFLRGFDADHGTDLALTVDGVPVNMVSHGHGQGYSDLHWIIPELVDRVEVKKGPYYAELGDFATAGAIDLVMKERVEENSVSVTGGMFDTYRGLVAVSPTSGDLDTLLAAEVATTNGPFASEEALKRYNVFARAKTKFDFGDLTLTGTAYGASWNASGQLPQREVLAGRLDRFGSIDPNEGGTSSRLNAYAKYQHFLDDGTLTASAYLTHYRFQLFSDFTFFSRNAVSGDMIEQTDDRVLTGAALRYTRQDSTDFLGLGWVTFATTAGLDTRTDFIDNGLYDADRLERRETVVDAGVRESSLGLFASTAIEWNEWLRTTVGLRGDLFDFAVTDRLPNAPGSGSAQSFLLSPKASVAARVLPRIDLYASFGRGFHSNDARGIVLSDGAVTPQTVATGYELGARTRLFDRLDLAAAVYLLDLDSEIVWIGDEGTTEANGPTRRMGVEAEARLEVLKWLYADVDVTVARARFVDAPAGEDQIPLAPRLTVGGGLSAIHPSGISGRIALVHIGARPATEDGFIAARAFTKADLSVGYRAEQFEITLSVQNLLNAEVNEAQFATVSRLPNERSSADCAAGTRAVEGAGGFEGCEDLHFAPGPPLSAQLGASFFF